MKTKHQYAIEHDSRIMLTHEASFVCAMSRAAYFPLSEADFSASGCIDAPMWIPAGSCGQWFHSAGHVGMIVMARGEQ